MICKDDDDDDADKEEEEKHDRIGGCHKEVGWTFVSYADKLLQWARTRRPLWKHEKKRKKKKDTMDASLFPSHGPLQEQSRIALDVCMGNACNTMRGLALSVRALSL